MNVFRTRCVVVGLLLAYGFNVHCQEAPVEKKLLLSNHTQVGLTVLQTLDNYLSDLEYTGVGLQLRNVTRRYLSTDNQRWSLRSDLTLGLGVCTNYPQTATMSCTQLNYGVGLQRHWRVAPNLQLLLGGMADMDLATRASDRDVNNSANIDASINLNALATLRYDFRMWDRPFRFLMDARTPLLGAMFVPHRGESYYEIVTLGDHKDLSVFSSLHNKNGMNLSLLLQLPLRKVAWNIGLLYDRLVYTANGVAVRRNASGVLLGAAYDFSLFSRTRKNTRTTYLSSEW
jgi:hypothetical protein